ncbi:MAG: DUF1302 domain-containing protein [Proteobacteria bacterium]|nr:DUF1302 domain-containing protein [Pseudomonadota bacterium]
MIKFLLVAFIFHLFFPFFCLSQEKNEPVLETGVEDILEDFNSDQTDVSLLVSNDPEKKNKTSRFDFKGYFKLGVTYNYAHDAPLNGQTDWRGLSSLCGEVFSQVRIDLSDKWKSVVSLKGFYDAAYDIHGRSKYTEPVLETDEKALEFREVYIQGSLFKNLDARFGRQIVVWGTSDNLRVTDVLNPLDLREPGVTDIEDLRLPITMSKLDLYFGNFSLTGIAVHEQRFNKNPAFGSDFYPLDAALPREEIIENDWDNTDLAICLKKGFDKVDISFYLARMFNDQAHMYFSNALNPASLTMTHARLNMAGTAAQLATGNFLFKAEAAYFDGLRFFNRPDKSFSRWDVLFGVEYFGFKETLISLEAVNRHLSDWDSALETTPDYTLQNDFQTVLRVSKDFLNDRLTLTFLGSMFGLDAKRGAFQRFSMEYDFTDTWSVLSGIVLYQSGDKIEMKKIGANDRIFFNLKYSF